MDHINAGDGAVYEESIKALENMSVIANKICTHKGAALIIDYGYDIPPHRRLANQYCSSLQAVKRHKFHPVLDSLGEVDISTHVDFYALKSTAQMHGCKTFGAMNQGDFLHNLGIDLRLRHLKNHNPDKADILTRQYKRLTDLDQMGGLFKVIAVTDNTDIIPLGF
jgi:SAM-dependent MidA family methyltransferase